MIPYEKALTIIKREFKKLKISVTDIPLEDAAGYLLAEDIYTDSFLPPFTNSGMDGFAIKYTKGKSRWEIKGEISAGNYESISVDENSSIRIMTGGKIPINSDTVIPLEDVIECDDVILLASEANYSERQNVRIKGEDIQPGQLAIASNTLLKPQNISMAAACGKSTLKVYDKIKVGILATGDELIDVSLMPEGDKIRATNLYTLISLIKESGMTPVNLGIIKDNKKAITEKLSSALNSDIDILITTGGVSVGKYDYLKDIYKEFGVEIYFSKMNVKPGKPVVFGRFGEKLIFGLPGNPVSSFVTFQVLIKQALQEYYRTDGIVYCAELCNNIKKSDFKRHFVRGIIEYNSSCKKYFVEECGSQSSGNMSGLNVSNCLIIIPEEKMNPSAGEMLQCLQI